MYQTISYRYYLHKTNRKSFGVTLIVINEVNKSVVSYDNLYENVFYGPRTDHFGRTSYD